MAAAMCGANPAHYTPTIAERVYELVATAAAQPDVKAAVEANHDDNRWWPLFVSDWRVRMTVAGWSTRVSYAMIGTYADVVTRADALGWNELAQMNDKSLGAMVRPLGLTAARVSYLRSLAGFIDKSFASICDLGVTRPEELIGPFAASVHGAGYKVAQCAALYAGGYHCGIIPVDSGMVTRLAPFLGIRLVNGPIAHEQLRQILQACTAAHADAYRDLVSRLGYDICIPADADPTWLVHLVLIYFKRFYLNRPGPRPCPSRPACGDFLDCGCSDQSKG
jgi:endonuclease III